MAYKIVNDDSLTSVANAIRVQGSISGTLEFPDGFVSAIQNLSPSPTLQTKTKTYTPTTSQQTESVVADSGYDGLDEVDVTVNAIPSQYKDTTDATATADKILQGYTAYANGQKLVGTASGGITPSGTISITQNGQVDVTNYATADVNVSGGGGSSYTLLAEQTIVVESASSTATKVATLSCGSDAWTYNNMVYFKIRCTEKINSHFYGYDLFYIRNTDSANITIGNYTGGTYYKFGYAGAMIATKSTTGLGVYPNNLKENGDIDIFTKTNSNASNIPGTYHVEVYALKWPNDVSPFDA